MSVAYWPCWFYRVVLMSTLRLKWISLLLKILMDLQKVRRARIAADLVKHLKEWVESHGILLVSFEH